MGINFIIDNQALKFEEGDIISILDSNLRYDIMDNLLKYEINNQKIDLDDIAYFKSPRGNLFNINVSEDIKYPKKQVEQSIILDYLHKFNLDESILKKNYAELSDSESQKIGLINTFVIDRKIIFLNNPTKNLDYKSVQNLIKIIKQEKKNKKLIFITSFDTNFILEVSNNTLYEIDNKIIYEDKYKTLSNTQLLKKLNLIVPNIINFENLVISKKNINLGYRDNINDLIKDVYRNAR